MTVADSEQFTNKNKPITYIEVFVELYYSRNRRQVYEIYKMVELEKMCASTAEHPYNLGIHYILEISSIFYSTHIVPRNQEKIVFYVHNYID